MSKKKNIKNILIKGGCDIDALSFYLNMKNINKEGSFKDDNGKTLYISGHSVVIENIVSSINWNSYIPYIDKNTYKSSILSQNYKVIVLSLIGEAGVDVYHSKKLNSNLIYGPFNSHSLNNNDITKYDFEYLGKTPPNLVCANFKKLIETLPTSTNIIFLLGPTLRSENREDSPIFKNSENYYKILNEMMKTTFKHYINVSFIDPNKYILKKSFKRYFFRNYHSIVHYKRKVYYYMAKDLHRLFPKVIKSSLKNEIKRDIRNILVSIKSKFSKRY